MIRLSKEISYLLRHTTLPQGDPNGWVAVPLLQQHLRRPASIEEIKRVVEKSDKKRFVLDEESDPPRIRAAQGHTVELEQPLLERIANPDSLPCVVHVTSEHNWRGVREAGELRRMSRTHVHFASASQHLRRNAWASVLLRLDLKRAMQDGIAFYRAANDVVLSEGPIPLQYLVKIEREDLPKDWQDV